MLLMFLWACKHFYSKHISCKMLEPHSTKEQEGQRCFQPTARGQEQRPHSEQLPRAWVGMCNTGKTKLVK